MREILTYLQENRDRIVSDLGEFVGRETPSTEKAALDDFARFLKDYAEDATGGRAEIVANEGGGDHVRIECAGRGRPVMLLGHFDTVWPLGTLTDMPFRVEDGIASGPGIFDMKCGLVQGLWAVRTLRELELSSRPVVFVCNSDEEIGSPTSRDLIEREARAASTVLVLEPSADGALKTARKGAGKFRLTLTGRAAHAGLDPFGGASAIEELGRVISRLHALTDPESGTTLNVGTVSGGTRFNVIAAEARAEIDLRVATKSEEERMVEVLSNLETENPEVSVEVEGGMIWPPMERTERTARLADHAKMLSRDLGFSLEERSVGGASDGSLCAALGVPTLDGLGAVGGGAHATNEHVGVDHIPLRAALVAHLIETV